MTKIKTTGIGALSLDTSGGLALVDVYASENVAHEAQAERGTERYILMPVFGFDEVDVKVNRKVVNPVNTNSKNEKR